MRLCLLGCVLMVFSGGGCSGESSADDRYETPKVKVEFRKDQFGSSWVHAFDEELGIECYGWGRKGGTYNPVCWPIYE